jgi:hypothetical protein
LINLVYECLYVLGDSLQPLSTGAGSNSDGMRFSTYDKDQDGYSSGNCVAMYGDAGWWYDACLLGNLNGKYTVGGTITRTAHGIVWYTWHEFYYTLKATEMKMKPITA